MNSFRYGANNETSDIKDLVFSLMLQSIVITDRSKDFSQAFKKEKCGKVYLKDSQPI